MVLQQMSQYSSTNQLHVFAFQVGRLVWLNKDYCLNTSSLRNFSGRVGTLGIYKYSILIFDEPNFLLKIP